MASLTWNRRQHIKAHPDEPDVPLCSKCGLANDRAPQRYCSSCNRDYQREWKRRRVLVPLKELTEEQRAKLRSPRIVSRATKVSG